MKYVQPRTDTLRDTLRFVADSDILARYKNVLMEVVGHALLNAEEDERVIVPDSEGTPWQQPEEQIVADYLKGRTAVNWQHADELAIGLAARLNRSPADVKKKAKELGFGVGVDYRLARESGVREGA